MSEEKSESAWRNTINLTYLGDALDHWKGSLFERLRKQGQLREFKVDPMLTDHKEWVEADLAAYAELLHVQPQQIIRHERCLAARDEYFAEIERKNDLFLDPDTGIVTGRASLIARYIKPKELANLLEANSSRLIVVYQHVRIKKTSERVCECIAAIEKERKSFGWCSYESSTVAMLFLCDDLQRTDAVCRTLRRPLRGCGERRVRCGAIGVGRIRSC